MTHAIDSLQYLPHILAGIGAVLTALTGLLVHVNTRRPTLSALISAEIQPLRDHLARVHNRVGNVERKLFKARAEPDIPGSAAAVPASVAHE
jgi:hypothetical protein